MKMGSSFKKQIFDEHVQESLLGWAQKARKRKGAVTRRDIPSNGSSVGIQLQNAGQREPVIEEAAAGNSDAPNGSNSHQVKAP